MLGRAGRFRLSWTQWGRGRCSLSQYLRHACLSADLSSKVRGNGFCPVSRGL